VEIKIKWMIQKDMTYENTYCDDLYTFLLNKNRATYKNAITFYLQGTSSRDTEQKIGLEVKSQRAYSCPLLRPYCNLKCRTREILELEAW
jgi:hypothetical protein